MKLSTSKFTELIEPITKSRAVRQAVTRRSHYWFFNIFLSHYVKYETASFQREIFTLTEDPAANLVAVTAFRNSGKSTIVTLSYALWAILGMQQHKCVVIVSKTQAQAKIHFQNLRRELESNALLRGDLGPFEVEDAEWGAYGVTLPRYGAKIFAISSEQTIRGIRFNQYRPSLIICDDVEDIASVKTKEGRDKTYNWLMGEIIPLGTKETKIMVVGNLLHNDSLLMRLKCDIEEERLNGIFRAYPLLDETGTSLWPGQFPTPESIEALRKKIPHELSWRREYLLQIIPDEDQIIRQEWLRFYDELPNEKPRYTLMAVDLAISQKDSADKTAIVAARIYGKGPNLRIYILPQMVNARLEHLETIKKIEEMSRLLANGNGLTRVLVEDVAYQKSVIQILEHDRYPVEGISPNGQDKTARLISISHLIQGAVVYFPRQGSKDLIEQLTGFGVERYDDLVDATTMLLGYVMNREYLPAGGVTFIDVGRRNEPSWDDYDYEISSDDFFGRR